jgi:hypothetical protein
MRFYQDGSGNLQVDSEEFASVIGRFLIEDVQDSPVACVEILEAAARIFRGEMAIWRRVGNAHLLVLSRTGAGIESLFESTEEPCRMNLRDFGKIIESWRHFLEGRQ